MFNQFKPNAYDIKEYKASNYKKITLSEMYGRYFLKEKITKKYNPNYVLFTAPVFEHWDVELSTPEGRKYFEIKIRNQTYDDMILEVDKQKNLVKDNSYYVNITIDTNQLLIWDLNKIDFNNVPIEQKYCPQTSYSEKNDYVLKDCYMLPVKGLANKWIYNYSITEGIKEFEEQLNNKEDNNTMNDTEQDKI